MRKRNLRKNYKVLQASFATANARIYFLGTALAPRGTYFFATEGSRAKPRLTFRWAPGARDRTYNAIVNRFLWANVRGEVGDYDRSCHHCQHRKVPTLPVRIPLYPTPPPKVPFDTVGVDFWGPFPKTRGGNRYNIFAVDYLTKWSEARPVGEATTTQLIVFLENNILLRQGVPRVLISYRGTPLMSSQFSDYPKSRGI